MTSMPRMTKKNLFYRSKDWQTFRKIKIAENISANGGILTCDYCHKPIVDTHACHIHHITELTDENVDDKLIALSSANTLCLHHECHNAVHRRYTGTPSRKLRKVYLIYGAPCSGKEDYVKTHAERGDLVVSIDRITECVSATKQASKDLDPILFKIRTTILDCIKRRIGKWTTAWIVDSAPSRARREEICKQYNAEPVFIDSTIEECLQRRKDEGRDEVVDEYITRWFKEYRP